MLFFFLSFFNDLFQFAPVEPHAPAGGAHVEGHVIALHLIHGGVAVRAHQQRHSFLPLIERDIGAAMRRGQGMDRDAAPQGLFH